MNLTLPRITILGSHHSKLLELFNSHSENHERCAAIFFRRLSREVPGLASSDRYLSVDIVPFHESWITSSSSTHIDFLKAPLRSLFRKCKDEGLVFGFVHNHPNNLSAFSNRDSQNESSLLKGISNRNGLDSSLVALLWSNNEWIARVRHASDIDSSISVRHTSVLNDALSIYGSTILDEEESEILARQSAAFGKPFSAKLNSLRIAVVGAGGTGSPATTLLARSGIGEIISIDFDPFESSNLNRVRGSRLTDEGKNKAEIQRDFIKEIGVPCKIAAINGVIDTDYNAVIALSTADIIFGCTDDWAGRDLLNKALYYYSQALIDLGLGGNIYEGPDGQPTLRNHSGRVSCVMPEAGACLYCQGVIRPEWVAHQLAVRRSPEQADKDAKDGYLEGGGEAAPGVGPFTSATADLGVATLFDLIKPYRNLQPGLRQDNIYLDFVKMRLKSKAVKDNAECPYCRTHRFLVGEEESYLLGRPALKPKKE